MRQPPRLALWMLRQCVPETVTGDLVEEHASKHRSSGWFWRQSFSVSFAYLRESFWRGGLLDIGQGFRTTARRPLMALGIVLFLGLAMGANATMFGWVYETLFAPLPFPKGERLARVFQVKDGDRDYLSPPNFFDLDEREDIFASAAAYWSPSVTLTGRGEAERLLAATVSHDFFSVLGVEPVLGRSFVADDDTPGAPRVSVLAYAFWQRRFGGDPGILDAEIRVDGNPVRVVGIAPPGFAFPREGTELWIPLALPRTQPDRGGTPYRAFRILNVVARVRDGVTIEQATARTLAFARELSERHPESNAGHDLEVVSLHEEQAASSRASLLLLWLAMSAVMIIACANIGGLLLTRTASRQKELAVRRSLGASSFRVFRQLVAEGLVLAVASGALGLVSAYWGHRVLSIAFYAGLPLYVVGVVLVVGAFLGGVPGLLAVRGGWNDALRQGARIEGAGGGAATRRFLVVGEIALALLLLVAASLLLRSFHALRGLDLGFRARGVYFTSLEVPFSRYREGYRRAEFFRNVLERVRALSGVHRASLSLGVPLDPRAGFFVARSSFFLEGKPLPEAGQKPEAGLHVIDADYFATLGVPVLAGRDFDERDDLTSPGVVIVNEALARRFWPGEDPVGKRLTHDLTLLSDEDGVRRVIGVVSDFRYYELRRDPEPQLYIPFAQTPWPRMHLVLQASMSPDALQKAVSDVVSSLDRDVPVERLKRLEDVTAGSMAAPRRRALVLTSFATVAVVLAALGLYAVTAYSVLLRTHEIGIRVALGARRSEILSLVLREGLRLATYGAAAGVVGSLLVTPWLESLLFEVRATDPWSYLAVAAALVSVALVATYIPARRATKVDPIVALRAE